MKFRLAPSARVQGHLDLVRQLRDRLNVKERDCAPCDVHDNGSPIVRTSTAQQNWIHMGKFESAGRLKISRVCLSKTIAALNVLELWHCPATISDWKDIFWCCISFALWWLLWICSGFWEGCWKASSPGEGVVSGSHGVILRHCGAKLTAHDFDINFH